MPTTSNFGWTTPADTDLVKDGAAAIRTLGNGIDTSLVDLKGGTTGQYLIKQSNTDLDFTWTTNTADIDGITATSPLTGGGTSGTITVGIQDATTAQKGAVQLTNSTSSTSTTTAATPNSVKSAYDLAAAAIPNSLADAKGDLIAATANDTPARLAVGNNGEILHSDSSTSTGLRYNPQNALANPVINGGMDIWQRGTSFTIGTSTNTYAADRWQASRAGTAGLTVSRQTTSDTTNLPNIQYSLRMQRDSGNTSTASLNLWTNIETINSIPFAGKTITLSFYARAGANYSTTSNQLQVNLYTGTGTDQNVNISGFTGSATAISQSSVLTTSWQRFSYTATLATTTTEIAILFVNTPVGTAGANDWYEITGMQIDLGTYTASTAPTFRRTGGNIAGELAACQRYYYVVGGVANGYPIVGGALIATNNQIRFPIKFPTTMRIAPSITKNGTWNVSTNTTQPAAVFIGQEGFSIEISSSSGAVNAAYAYPDSTDDTFTCSSEL